MSSQNGDNSRRKRVFINTKGDNVKEYSEEFQAFMRYVTDSSDEVVNSVDSENLRIIHKRVTEVRNAEVMGIEDMQYFEELYYAKKDAEEIGEKRGEKRGLRIGRQEGIRTSVNNLMKNMNLTLEQAMELLGVTAEDM